MQRLYPLGAVRGICSVLCFKKRRCGSGRLVLQADFPGRTCQLDSIERVIPDSCRIWTLDRLATQPRFLATMPRTCSHSVERLDRIDSSDVRC